MFSCRKWRISTFLLTYISIISIIISIGPNWSHCSLRWEHHSLSNMAIFGIGKSQPMGRSVEFWWCAGMVWCYLRKAHGSTPHWGGLMCGRSFSTCPQSLTGPRNDPISYLGNFRKSSSLSQTVWRYVSSQQKHFHPVRGVWNRPMLSLKFWSCRWIKFSTVEAQL